MDKIENLINTYGYWGEHPELKLAQWQYEVDEDYTRTGYWEWVVAGLDEEETMIAR